MIQSMTGFGEAQCEEDGHAYQLEVRSVNHRYLKASIHLPDDLSFLEVEVERMLRGRLSRGSVDLRLRVRDLSDDAAQTVNVAAIAAYFRQLREAVDHDPHATVDLATLATLPGVCQPQELTDEQRQHFLDVITRLTNEALDRLIEMRRTEGAALAEDLRSHARQIRERLNTIRERGPAVVEEYRDRLLSRVNELIGRSNVQLAAEDLLREVSVYAERSDVAEEICRLDEHLNQFVEHIDGDQPAGRRLEFVSQEMLRETNTIGSKSGDALIARNIVEIKGALDRIKEQVQNIE